MPSWKKIITSGSVAILSNVTASSYTGSFTGSLLGTSSFATSASFAVSSSRAISSSFANTAISASFATTASFAVSSSRAISSSYALSASFAPGGAAFPFTGSAQITGSLTVIGATLVQDGSLGVVSTGTTNATDALKVQNATPDDLLVVKDDGELRINTTKYANNGVLTNNAGIVTEVVGFTGVITIIGNPPPNNLDFQNGILVNVF
jgi:hypothetical protein